jgi:hypothetical protein
MIAKVEAQQAWLENITYQMCNMVSLVPDIHPTTDETDDIVVQGAVQELGWTDCFPQDAID